MHDSGQKMVRARTWTHSSCTLCQLVCYCSLCPTNKSIHSVDFQVLTPCSGQVSWQWRFGRTCLWKEETGSTVTLKWFVWQCIAITLQAGCKECGQYGPQKRQTGQTLLSGPTATAKVRVECRTHHLLHIFSPPHDFDCPRLLQTYRTIAPHPHSNHCSVTLHPNPSQNNMKSARYPKTLMSRYANA